MPFNEQGYWEPDQTRYRLEIPGVLKGSNQMPKNRFALADYNRTWRGAAKLVATNLRVTTKRAEGWPIRGKARLHVTICYAHSHPLDDDNALRSLKPVVDGIVDAGLLADDNSRYVEWAPGVTHLRRHRPGVVIEIEELSPS